MLISILSILHVVVSLFLILAVLLQSGNADMGTAFGGSSSSVLGASGGNKFMTRLTSITAAVFFVTSLSLAILGTGAGRSSVVGDLPEPVVEEKKAEEAKAADAGKADAETDAAKDGAKASKEAPAAGQAKEAPASPAP